jgi:hypothetical protein
MCNVTLWRVRITTLTTMRSLSVVTEIQVAVKYIEILIAAQ